MPESHAPPARLGSTVGKAIIVTAVLGSALANMGDDMLNVALSTVSKDLAGAGLSGETFDGPEFAAGYGTAMVVCGMLAPGAALLAAVTIRPAPRLAQPASDQDKALRNPAT